MGLFDIGRIEIIVILVVVLLVFGPDLPGYAHKLGNIIRDLPPYGVPLVKLELPVL